MGRGILSGLIWGGLTGWVVVTVLSLYAPLADEKNQPETSQVDETVDGEGATAPVEIPTAAVDVETNSEPLIEPVAEAEIEAVADVDVEAIADIEPLMEPAAEDETGQLTPVKEANADDVKTVAAPEGVAASESQAEAEPDAEALIAEAAPEAQISAPLTATNQTDPSVSATPLPTTDAGVSGTQASTLTGDAGEALVPELEEPAAPYRPSVVTDAPEAPTASTAPALASLTDTANPTATTPGVPALPQVDSVPAASTDTPQRISIAAQTQVDEAVEPTPISSDTVIKLPVPKIENPVAGVVTNRLPSVTAPGAATEAVQEVVTEDNPEAEPLPTPEASDVGALNAFAATIEEDVMNALFSIILIDDGASGVPRAELINLAVPFSVAIDPVAPNAKAIAAEYRAAGIEVLAILGDLPPAAEPSDVAVAVAGYFGVLDEAIAVMDPLDGRIQSNRSLLQPILGAIRDSGHGLVTYDRGLNTAQQTARREGIPAATVFRVLDQDEEASPKIKRYLGRAAFNASKDGAVVVVGHTRAETIKAILEWSLDEKSGEFSIVPVSVVMQEDQS